ncbi:hypothetical protein CRYUN_Cryun40dG0013400 [Craigia yunnanensis]
MAQKAAVISICSVFLVAMVVAVAVGVNRSRSGSGNGSGAPPTGEISTSAKAIKSICQPTDYKKVSQLPTPLIPRSLSGLASKLLSAKLRR